MLGESGNFIAVILSEAKDLLWFLAHVTRSAINPPGRRPRLPSFRPPPPSVPAAAHAAKVRRAARAGGTGLSLRKRDRRDECAPGGGLRRPGSQSWRSATGVPRRGCRGIRSARAEVGTNKSTSQERPQCAAPDVVAHAADLINSFRTEVGSAFFDLGFPGGRGLRFFHLAEL